MLQGDCACFELLLIVDALEARGDFLCGVEDAVKVKWVFIIDY